MYKKIELTPVQARVRAQISHELLYRGFNKLANMVWELNFHTYKGGKQSILANAIRDLIARNPQNRKQLYRTWEYVSWLLDDTYTWFS